MKPQAIWLLAIVFGIQLGLPDLLLFPAYMAGYGELSFLLLYGVFKIALVWPLFLAEWKAGEQLNTPIKKIPRFGHSVFLILLCLAILWLLVWNLHKSTWLVALTQDLLTGHLVDLNRLDFVFYWYALRNDHWQFAALLAAQIGFLVVLVGGGWRLLGWFYASLLSLAGLFLLLQMPAMVELLSLLRWQSIQFESVMVALRYALLSSLAGFFIWYYLARLQGGQIKASRWLLAAQLFDVFFSLALVAIMPNLLQLDVALNDTGALLQVLAEIGLSQQNGHFILAVMLMIAATLLNAMLLLWVLSWYLTQRLNPWLILLMLILVFAVAQLVLSASAWSWYGWSLANLANGYMVFFFVPTMAFALALWLNWQEAPKQLLQSAKSTPGWLHGFWRGWLGFVMPAMLGILWFHSMVELTALSYWQWAASLVLIALMVLCFYWLKKYAHYPT